MEQTYSDADKSHVVRGLIVSYGIFFKEGATESFLKPHKYSPISDTDLL